jgi:hypothetical protein
MLFKTQLNWDNKKQLFNAQLKKNRLDLPPNLYAHIFDSPKLFDNIILNYQVSKTDSFIHNIKERIENDEFLDKSFGDLIVHGIDWSIFHRQVFPAFCSSQILDYPLNSVIDLIYCYSFLVIGPTQLLDDKMDNPFKTELHLKDYNDKKTTELWAISDIMIRRGVELFMRLSPNSFKHIAPLTFDMTYSMYRENKIGNYNHNVLTEPNIVLEQYSTQYAPDMSSIFNETMFIGAMIHLGAKDITPFIPISKDMRLLRQQLNELEDFFTDLICGFVKKPAAQLLNDRRFGRKFKKLITSQIWTSENLNNIKENSLNTDEVEFLNWLSKTDYCRESIDLFINSGVAEKLYIEIDNLCFRIIENIENALIGTNYFDLLTVVLLKKALLERLNKCSFYPQKLINEKLAELNNK